MAENIAVPLRPAVRRHGWVRTRLLPPLVFWLVSYAALAVLGTWLWENRGVISAELLFWEANRVLAVAAQPPNPSVVMLTYPPVILFLAILAGSAISAAALLGASVMTMLSGLWHRSGASWPWLVFVLVHPALVISAVEYPSLLMRAALLLVMLYCDFEYLSGGSPQFLFGGAFALGGLALVDSGLWPLWVYLTVVLVMARRRPLVEHLSILLVALMPVVFLTLSWAYLTWTQTGLAHYHVQTLPDAIGAGAWIRDTLGSVLTPGDVVAAVGQRLATLARVAPAYLLLWVVFVVIAIWPQPRASSERREPFRGRVAQVLLLAAPLVDLISSARGGQANLSVVGMTLPVIALPLMWRAHRLSAVLRWAVGILLLVGLVWSWALVLQPAAIEPNDLMRQVAAQEASPPYHAVAQILNQRLRPGQRVLLDENRTLPLVALIHDSQALLLSNNPDYLTAQLFPAQSVDYVVATDGDKVLQDDAGHEFADFDLLFEQNGLRLYMRRGS